MAPYDFRREFARKDATALLCLAFSISGRAPFPFPPVTIVVDEDASKVMSVPPCPSPVADELEAGDQVEEPDSLSMPIPPFQGSHGIHGAAVSPSVPSSTPADGHRYPHVERPDKSEGH
jgi:hypothetical protein